jgi:hypothetical protein
MSYDIGRTNAIRRAYAGHIKSFVERYIRGRKTVVLLPGGMGSQLDFSPRPYDGVPMSFADYETAWMDIGVVFDRDVLKLEIDDQGRDKDGHIVVPNGPLRFLLVAYDGTAQYFQERDFNMIVFGYDWRRPIEECAGFLEDFLDQLRKNVFNKHHEDPLPMTTLLCHSQGGLVAKLFMHRIFSASGWFDKVITVGTPFYGTWSHQRRFFIGQQPLNILYGAGRMAKVVATLPGPYTLMLIDQRTFEADHARLGLAPGAYPVTDPETGVAVDPYDGSRAVFNPGWLFDIHPAAGCLSGGAPPVGSADPAAHQYARGGSGGFVQGWKSSSDGGAGRDDGHRLCRRHIKRHPPGQDASLVCDAGHGHQLCGSTGRGAAFSRNFRPGCRIEPSARRPPTRTAAPLHAKLPQRLGDEAGRSGNAHGGVPVHSGRPGPNLPTIAMMRSLRRKGVPPCVVGCFSSIQGGCPCPA